MAITSTSASGLSSSPGSSIDVAGIVSQLMAVEQKPINLIDNKLQSSDLKISALASFQGKLSAFNDALNALQTPANFQQRSVTASSTSALTASVSADQAPLAGRYTVTVAQTASPALVNVTGLTSSAQALTDPTSFGIQLGNVNYQVGSGDGVATLSDLKNWINTKEGLKDAVRATLIQQSPGQWVLALQGLATGAGQQFSATWSEPNVRVAPLQSAQDARFTVNGVEVTRSTNTVSDVIPGLNFQLLSASATPTVLDVTEDHSAVSQKVQSLVTTYNDLLAEYKRTTQSSLDASQRGVLNSDLTLSTIMRQINEGLMRQVKLASGASAGSRSDLSLLGIEFNNDGSLKFNQTLFDASPQLPSVLAQGISLGYVSSTQSLSTTLTIVLGNSGTLADRIEQEKTTQSDLSKRRTQLQDKLATLQERYTAQYAALDALLFKLNNTNNALKSALDGLTNAQKNN